MIKFKFEKLVRSETLSFIFARVGVEGVKIARTVAKLGVHVFIWNGHPNLSSNFNSKNLVKSETPSFDFAKVWLNEGKIAMNITNFFMHSYLTRNLTKICVHAYVPNGISVLSLRFHLKGEKIARNVTKLAVYDCLLKWVPKSTFKFQFW